ncbi:hypothetical protein [Methylobacterium sp. ARG-1]|uniref:hypothetical protein n=1 Tax=Methylobacterium sp. ARG-1 TaxID=1692501 RepID=UPI000681D045|nr:hypothetical protein [Methylobacterium sp. ARG-1]KNY19133.1 hypothetical protein AKJ13_29410 [Methylobacterium sp. ARG-1]
MQHSDTNADGYRPAGYIMKRFGVTRLTLHNWITRREIGFPAPALRIAGHRYWRVSDLAAFEAAQAAKQHVSDAA